MKTIHILLSLFGLISLAHSINFVLTKKNILIQNSSQYSASVEIERENS
jgi:hypothetical protein